jgi:hypothetical protein
MKFDITQRIHVVDAAIDATGNKLHKAILENYRRHANLEVCGLWEQILTPDMTVPEPVYRIHNRDQLRIANGMAAVRSLYRSLVEAESTVIYHTDEYIMVSDEGLMTNYISHRFWPGHKLQAQGVVLSDGPNAHYIVSQSLNNFFPYNEHGILKGEIVYHGADMHIARCPPEELITVEECRERLLPLMKSADEIRLRA